MSLPDRRRLLVLALLLGGPAAAQLPTLARQRQDRRVSLPSTSDELATEIRLAAGNLTTLLFDALLDRDSLEVDRTRFKLVDVGERSINLVPATELGSGSSSC